MFPKVNFAPLLGQGPSEYLIQSPGFHEGSQEGCWEQALSPALIRAPSAVPSDGLGWFSPGHDSSLPCMCWSGLHYIFKDSFCSTPEIFFCATSLFLALSLKSLPLLASLNSQLHLLTSGRPPGSAWVPFSALQPGNCLQAMI